MRRLFALLLVVVIALSVVLFMAQQQSTVVLKDAKAVAVAGQDGTFIVTLTVENNGDAVRMVGASANGTSKLELMNPGYAADEIVVPAGGRGLFAMDGAHFMLRTDLESFPPGAFVPITLSFDGQRIVSTRVLHSDAGTPVGMQHGQMHGVSVDTAPRINMTAPDDLGEVGGSVAVEFENFTLVNAPNDAAHVPNEGHAHVYLNGLKLQRLYGSSFEIGKLPRGRHELRVSLNANDHRPYVDENGPIQAVQVITVP